jgi:general L-amino acid transport system permease protein
MTSAATARPPLWRDTRVIAWVLQIAVVVVVVAVGWWLLGTYQDNVRKQGRDRSLSEWFDFLGQPAGFPVASSSFRPTQRTLDAIAEGLLNTLRLAVTGIVLATILGTLIGIARLSQNFIVRSAARVYVEVIRNVPLLALVLLAFIAVVQNAFPPPNASWDLAPFTVINVRGASVFWFEGPNWKALLVLVLAVATLWGVARWRRSVNDRTGRPARSGLWGIPAAAVVVVVGWLVLGLGVTAPELDGRRVTGGVTMTAAYFGALLALVVYTSSHIAEIVRGSIQAVPKGQGEAADALALSSFQRMWHVVLPQAMRIAVPATGNQYLNLMKNSSLAAVISFPELTKVTQLAVATRAPALPAYTLLLLIYLAISLVISLIVNLINRRLAIAER